LIFWASSETDRDADTASNVIRRCVEPYLNAAFGTSTLAELECELRYVPIIMPEDSRERYPARSKLRKKQRVYDCCPQLNYDVFVQGTFESQLQEYLRGIALSAPHLAGLGASRTQIEEFEKILQTAAERILVERPDQSRH
jgi:hypothetical protein